MHPLCWENRLISSWLAKQFPLSGIVLKSSLGKNIKKGASEKFHSLSEKAVHTRFFL